MQTSLAVNNGAITGTLKYLSGSNAITDVWGEGNFMCLDFNSTDFSDLTSVLVGLDPSQGSGLVEIIDDPDKNGVFKITNKDTQVFKIVATDSDNNTSTVTYDLSGLTLEAAPVPPTPTSPFDDADAPDGQAIVKRMDWSTNEVVDTTVSVDDIQEVIVVNKEAGRITGKSKQTRLSQELYEPQDGYYLALDLTDCDFTDYAYAALRVIDTRTPSEIKYSSIVKNPSFTDVNTVPVVQLAGFNDDNLNYAKLILWAKTADNVQVTTEYDLFGIQLIKPETNITGVALANEPDYMQDMTIDTTNRVITGTLLDYQGSGTSMTGHQLIFDFTNADTTGYSSIGIQVANYNGEYIVESGVWGVNQTTFNLDIDDVLETYNWQITDLTVNIVGRDSNNQIIATDSYDASAIVLA